MKISSFLLLLIILHSCQDKKINPDEARAEILAAEKAFEAMAADKGVAEAFWYYADSNATIKRENDTLIHGKEQIRQYYSKEFYNTAKVKWTPDFIDVSSDGNMAYTYGKYVWSSPDTSGQMIEFNGIFHTVWKRQKGGEWKYVWD